MKTLLEIIQLSTDFLKKSGVESPRREAEDVIADALGLKRLDLYLQFERPLTEKELEHLRECIKRKSKREPYQYISGKVSFADLEFKVCPKVLIPRQETEILIEKISTTLKQMDCKGKILWDICSGSGCIGISLKKRFPELQVFCSDISKEALSIAKENAKNLQAEISFKEGDLFHPFVNEGCDFFVCNPPYIAEGEYACLMPEVLYEPKSALVSGQTGLEFYTRIAKELKPYLNTGGKGWLEMGSGQGLSINKIFTSQGWSCRFEPDWAGHDRFFFIEKE